MKAPRKERQREGEKTIGIKYKEKEEVSGLQAPHGSAIRDNGEGEASRNSYYSEEGNDGGERRGGLFQNSILYDRIRKRGWT